MRRVLIVAATALTVGGGGAGAQSLLLRFAATEGQEVVRLFQVHTAVSEQSVDGTVRHREVARLGQVRERVLGVLDDRHVLHLAIDSLVVRSRSGDGPWREAAPGERPWVQLHASERLALEHRGGATEESPLLQYLVAGFPGHLLPERPVWPGRVWRQTVDVPAAVMTLGVGPESAGQLALALEVVVDSLVQRAQDTLAYLSVNGEAAPAQVRNGPGRVVDYRGSATGTLVWSTGWSRFVTAAMRTAVTIDIADPTGSTVLRVQTTIRQAVRSSP